MKILFINKYDTHGGAAIAAWRLQEGLYEKYHTTNKLLCGIKFSDLDFVKETRKKGWENFLERGLNFGFNQLGLQYFWFPFSTGRILEFTKKFQPDIISLHNLHGGFFKTTLLKELSVVAPLVWTLHDMWAFTASGAYTGGDESWKEMKRGRQERKQFPAIGIDTGRFLIRRKKNIYAQSRLTYVCPSGWMQNMAKQSPVLRGKEILHIPNGINLDRFCPAEDKEELYQKLKISPSQKVLLLFAENINDERKGSKDLKKILMELDSPENKNVLLLIAGSGKLPMSFQYLQVRALGFLSGEKAIIPILQVADLFIFPTHEDNLPNTLIEAIACGVPCITYNVGGCGEIIKDNFNGKLIPARQYLKFYKAITAILDHPEELKTLKTNARAYAVQNFDIQQMTNRYYALFQDILNREQEKKEEE